MVRREERHTLTASIIDWPQGAANQARAIDLPRSENLLVMSIILEAGNDSKDLLQTVTIMYSYREGSKAFNLTSGLDTSA